MAMNIMTLKKLDCDVISGSQTLTENHKEHQVPFFNLCFQKLKTDLKRLRKSVIYIQIMIKNREFNKKIF